MSTRPDVLVVSYYFPPNEAVGGLRPYRFCKYLMRDGYRCHLVTASPQQTSFVEQVAVVPDPTAAIWERKPTGRLPVAAQLERICRKLFTPGGVGLSWSFRAADALRAIIRQRRERRFVLLSSYPPIGALLAGLRAAPTEGIPWICDMRDPLPPPSYLKGFPLAPAAFRWLEALSFRKAAAVIANTDAAGEAWRSVFPRLADRIHVIANGFDPEERSGPRSLPPRPHKTLVHAGAMYGGRNANIVIKALARLRPISPEARHTRVVLLGSVGRQAAIHEAVYAQAQTEGWLDYRPWNAPRSEAARLTEESDFLLLLQPQTALQVPAKLFDYICIGRPILALAPRYSEVERILERAGVPYACIYPSDEPGAVDRKLVEFLRFPSDAVRCSGWFESEFDAAKQSSRLASLMDAVWAAAA